MVLSACYLFQGLSVQQLDRIAAITREIQMQKGQRLLSEGQEAREVYVLKEGGVELMMNVEADFEIPVSMLRTPGGCFGTSALTEPHQYGLSARCTADGSLLAPSLVDLQGLMRQDRDLGYTIMSNLARNLRDRLRETREELKVHFRTLFKSMHS